MLKRLMAMFLMVMVIASSIPITSLAAGDYIIDSNGNGTGGSSTNTGVGTMSYDQTGYRMYLADQNGKRVSDIVDMVNKEPVLGGVYATGTKLDGSYTGVTGNIYTFGFSAVAAAISNKEYKFTSPPYPIMFNSSIGQYQSQGLKFKAWLLNGHSSYSDSGVSVDVSEGYELQPSKEQTFPPDKGSEPITSTDVYSTIEAIALNYLDTLYQLPHPEYNMSQYSAKAASGSTLQHLTNFIHETAAQNALTSKQMQVVIA